MATETVKAAPYNLLILLDCISVTTALDGYASEGLSQRISAVERASEGECRDGVELAQYA